MNSAGIAGSETTGCVSSAESGGDAQTLGGLELETRNLAAAEAALLEAEALASEEPAELAKIAGARLTEAEAARDLGRLYAATGRVTEAQAALPEAARAFFGSGSTSARIAPMVHAITPATATP